MSTEIGSSPWRGYQNGGSTRSGDVIADILAKGDRCCVFLDSSGYLQWEYDEKVCIDGESSVATALELLARLKVTAPRKKTLRRAQSLIAAALSRAFEERRENDGRDFFSAAAAYIDARRTEVLHIWYVSAALITAALLSTGVLSFAHLNPAMSDFLRLAAPMGACGAVISVALRFREIPIELYSSRGYTAIGGFLRVFFGAAFGAIALLFQRAGLLLTVLGTDAFTIASVAFVAGFSERFVPDLIVSLEQRLAKDRPSE
jgi:hypothetical protein